MIAQITILTIGSLNLPAAMIDSEPFALIILPYVTLILGSMLLMGLK